MTYIMYIKYQDVTAPNASVKLTETVGVTCGFCCEVTSNMLHLSPIDLMDQITNHCNVYYVPFLGFFLLLLKKIHNRNHKILIRTDKLLRKKRFFLFVSETKNTNVPPGVPICLPSFLVNKCWFPKMVNLRDQPINFGAFCAYVLQKV